MMQRRDFLATLGAAAAAASGVAGARGPAADEALFTAGLTLPVGPAGRCDEARVGGPVVRWDEAIGQWRMWYYCRDNAFPAGLAPAFGSGSLATATSTDGFRWTRVDGPLAGGAVMVPSTRRDDFDSTHLATGDVIRHGDEWLMVYHAGNHETPQGEGLDPEYRFPGYVLRLGLARSRDGITWTRIRGKATGGAILEVPEGDVYAAFPNFIHDGKRFLLYYTTVDREGRWYRTRMAASTDLVTWQSLGDLVSEDDPLPFEGGGMITRDVLRNPLAGGPRWLMVYTAKDGRPESGARRSVGVSVSDDGLRWSRLYDQAVLSVGRKGAWDSMGTANPRLVVTPRDMRLYYYGWSDKSYLGHPARGIGCAVAQGRDFAKFRRIIGG
jgi:predicted GH43/DUF377 family glycosyl hydrolase